MTEKPLKKPRYKPGLAETEQVTTEAIEQERAERMAKYGGGDISGMSHRSVAPAQTVSKAPKRVVKMQRRGEELKQKRVPEAGGAVGGVSVDRPKKRDLSEGTIGRRFNLTPVDPAKRTPPPEKPLVRPKPPAKKPKVSRAVTFAQELGDKPRTGGFAATVSPSTGRCQTSCCNTTSD